VDTGVWLSATVGLPASLGDALRLTTGRQPQKIVRVDAGMPEPVPREWFRAPASLVLPTSDAGRVGVAALVVRPDRRTCHLLVDGTYMWPDDAGNALRALERIVQAHVEQWLPPRALWSAPAERLLGDEIR
jgi:hypothetical protein